MFKRLREDIQTIKDHLYFSLYDGEGIIFETDCEDEAVEFATKVRGLGIDAIVEKETNA